MLHVIGWKVYIHFFPPFLFVFSGLGYLGVENPARAVSQVSTVCLKEWVFVSRGFFGFFLFLFRAAPVAYGGSHARGWIGAAAASLCHGHSNARSELCLWPNHSSWQGWLLNSLSEARDWTSIPMDTSQIRFRLDTMGTPRVYFLKLRCNLHVSTFM